MSSAERTYLAREYEESPAPDIQAPSGRRRPPPRKSRSPKPAQDDDDLLESFLVDCRLLKFMEQIRELGATAVEDLRDLSDADMNNIGLKPLEKKRLLDALESHEPAADPASPTTALLALSLPHQPISESDLAAQEAELAASREDIAKEEGRALSARERQAQGMKAAEEQLAQMQANVQARQQQPEAHDEIDGSQLPELPSYLESGLASARPVDNTPARAEVVSFPQPFAFAAVLLACALRQHSQIASQRKLQGCDHR